MKHTGELAFVTESIWKEWVMFVANTISSLFAHNELDGLSNLDPKIEQFEGGFVYM